MNLSPHGDGEVHIHLHLSSSSSTLPVIVAPDGRPAVSYMGGELSHGAPTSPSTTPTISHVQSEPIEVQNAIMILRSRFAGEVDALLLGCFVLQTREKKSNVFTSEITNFLRNDIGGYNIPNPAALIRSVEKRKTGGLKILGKKTEGRHDLEFGLTEEYMKTIGKRLAGKGFL